MWNNGKRVINLLRRKLCGRYSSTFYVSIATENTLYVNSVVEIHKIKGKKYRSCKACYMYIHFLQYLGLNTLFLFQLSGNTTYLLDSLNTLKGVCSMEVMHNEVYYVEKSGNGKTLVDVIMSLLCPQNCSGNGNCASGTCTC